MLWSLNAFLTLFLPNPIPLHEYVLAHDFVIIFFLFGCIFILLSRESDQCAIRARLGVAGHLSTTPRWGNPVKCLWPACSPHCPINAERQAGKL